MYMDQDFLRKQVKIAKAYNQDWTFSQFAQVIGVSTSHFYNWLNGQCKLSYETRNELESLLADLLEQ